MISFIGFLLTYSFLGIYIASKMRAFFFFFFSLKLDSI